MDLSTHKKPIRHGGNLARAEDRFGTPQKGWLDLSTGINPVPYPMEGSSFQKLDRLPDPSDMTRLISSAKSYFACKDAAHIVAAPGTQMILQWLPRLFNKTTVAILEPTYGEHRATWELAGHEVIGCSSLEEAEERASFIILVNPNNPTGQVHQNDDLLALAERLQARNGLLVVDGAFEDVLESAPMSTHAGTEGLMVLRSFGKFFGLAGVRLGFALCPRRIGEALAAQIGPWAVSQPAIDAGETAMGDTDWACETRTLLKEQSIQLETLLENAELKIIGGTTLFHLIESPDAQKLYEHLGRAGILVRPFDERPNWIRFGLPGNVKNVKRLREALETFRKAV